MESDTASDVGQGAEGSMDIAENMDFETSSTTGSTVSEWDPRCGNCSNTFDDGNHRAMSGECGHMQGSSCWAGNQNNCSTCSKESSTLQPSYALLTPRDLLSPEPIDPQPRTDGNGNADGSNKGQQQRAATLGVTASASAARVAVAPLVTASSAAPIAAPAVSASSSAFSTLRAQAAASMSSAAPSGISTNSNKGQQQRAATLGVAASASAARVAVAPLVTASSAAPIAAPAVSASSSAFSTLRAQAAATMYSAAPSGISTNSSVAPIEVKCINGKTVKKSLNPATTTVGQLKKLVHQESGISSERQQLLFKGKTMNNDSCSLASYKVSHGATIQMGTTNYGG